MSTPAEIDTTGEDFENAVRRALDAFWASLAQSFPQITTGDMAPGDDSALEGGAMHAARAWVWWNDPARD